MITKGLHINIWGFPDIHSEAEIGAFVEIGSRGDAPTCIGKCKIQAFVFIPPGITIEDNVFIGPGVMFANDRHPKANGEWTPLRTCIKHGASIGMGALIGPGITIGENAIIGMGAVVLTDVPAGETWVGNPARKLDKKE